MPLSLDRRRILTLGGGFLLAGASVGRAQAATTDDPLPSWNEGPRRTALLDFVGRVTKEGGPDFVPVPERIATFDNDGTLWCEQPIYFQFSFVIDRVDLMAAEHPEWKKEQPFKAVLERDFQSLAAQGIKAWEILVGATHTGSDVDTFRVNVVEWFETARHPRFKRPYDQLVYQPQLELLAHLRASGFKTFIVSGGGIEFIRAYAEKAYGIPPEQVVGSSIETIYGDESGKPDLYRKAKIAFVDDGPGKPVGIQMHIGRRPILALGNSDGDYEMLEWTTAGDGPCLGLIVRHDDAEREYAYDRNSKIGHLARALDAAPAKGWQVISMKDDWNTVFPAG